MRINFSSFSYLLLLYPTLLLSADVEINTLETKVASKLREKSAVLPPCQACKALVGSFKQGMDLTARSKFEGGDAAWEAEKMGSYRNSEVRLIEIQEKLCSEIKKGADQCHKLAEEAEPHFEKWWFELQKEKDLLEYICIESLKSCCPEDHYGPDCTPCPGFPDNVCNNNGKCKGNGTRKGNGACACNPGYSGEMCDSCAESYYAAYKDEKVLLCSPCHPACLGACTQGGSRGCLACKPGYQMDAEQGCVDVNECLSDKSSFCNPNQFCVNNDGSFSCLDCDHACDGCDGDGPDNCFKCAKGFLLNDNICVDEAQYSKDRHVVMTRYAVYAGLTVATCIIFQNNQRVAYAIGLAVALYIAASEHFNSQSNSHQGTKLPSSDISM